MPAFATIFLIATFVVDRASPALRFVGEFLVLVGTFTSTSLPGARWYAVVAATAMVWSAVYMLWMYQRVVMGDVTKPENRTLPDLSLREKFVLVPLVLLMIVMASIRSFSRIAASRRSTRPSANRGRRALRAPRSRKAATLEQYVNYVTILPEAILALVAFVVTLDVHGR